MESALPLLGSNDGALPGSSCPLVVADGATERHTKKTVGSKRQRTFTGCWTCRQRHVKCDGLRPSCRRCNTGKFRCQGYGTRLTWLTPNNQEELKSGGRSQLRAKPMDLSAISRQPPNREIPSITGNQARSSFSAFRAFEPQAMPKPRRLADQRGRATAAEEQTTEDVQLVGSSGLKTIQTTSINTSQNGAGWFGELTADMLITLNRDDAVRSVDHAQNLNVWAFDISSNCPPEADRHPLNRNTLRQHKPNGGRDFFDPFNGLSIPLLGGPMRSPCEALPASTRERELINHWATNLTNKLIPIRSPVNPFLTIVSPMALEGSRMARTKSTCTVALFHAVCAISAAHQANLRGHPLEDGLVLHHKNLSFHHLMQNLNRSEHDERMASLATLCLWILIHFITGTPGAWREVIKVTRNLLKETSADIWIQSTTAVLTYQSFYSAFALVQAQYLGRLEFPAPLETTLWDGEMPKGQIMPAQSLELVSSFTAKLLQTPCLPAVELDQLEIEFALSTPEPSMDFDISNAESAMLHYHRSLFYHASLLYFRCNSGRRGLEQEIQDVVSRCLDHMEHLEMLQDDSSPKTWICAAVAFEAVVPELRHRMRRLFFKRNSLGIATWATLHQAVEEVWKRRDASPPDFAPEPWTRILAEMPELDVILY